MNDARAGDLLNSQYATVYNFIESGFDENWIEVERLERIIGLVEGRRSERKIRTVQEKSIVK